MPFIWLSWSNRARVSMTITATNGTKFKKIKFLLCSSFYVISVLPSVQVNQEIYEHYPILANVVFPNTRPFKRVFNLFFVNLKIPSIHSQIGEKPTYHSLFSLYLVFSSLSIWIFCLPTIPHSICTNKSLPQKHALVSDENRGCPKRTLAVLSLWNSWILFPRCWKFVKIN